MPKDLAKNSGNHVVSDMGNLTWAVDANTPIAYWLNIRGCYTTRYIGILIIHDGMS